MTEFHIAIDTEAPARVDSHSAQRSTRGPWPARRGNPRGSGSRIRLSLEFTGVLAPLVTHLTRGFSVRYLALESNGLKQRSEAYQSISDGKNSETRSS
jgi:hypothetical protein